MKLDSDENVSIYNLSLMMAFAANVFLLISVSLLFRYADFVSVIGGNEWHLGWIVGASSVGAVILRLWLGTAIDRFGPEWIWYCCLAGQIFSLYGHLFIQSPDSINVFLVRFVYATCLAGTFGSWLSFVSLQAPTDRVAEVIGVIGASGFVGMAIGPIIGDYIFASNSSELDSVKGLFLCAISALAVSTAFTIGACRLGKVRPHLRLASKNPIQVIAKAQPGFVLILGMLMGISIGFPGTYLRPMAASLDIDQIKLFFITYNLVAFVSRLIFRQAPTVMGLHKTITVGFSFMAASMLMYLVVDNEYKLIWPALLGGLGHSFLFPSVIALCTQQFAKADRGVAANLILAMYDSGVLIGMPTIGILHSSAEYFGLSPYSTIVVALMALILVVLAAFWRFSSRPKVK